MSEEITLSKMVGGIFREKSDELDAKIGFCLTHKFAEEARWLESQRSAINSVRWAVEKAIGEYEKRKELKHFKIMTVQEKKDSQGFRRDCPNCKNCEHFAFETIEREGYGGSAFHDSTNLRCILGDFKVKKTEWCLSHEFKAIV